MFLTKMSRSAILVSGVVFALSIFIGLSAGIGLAQCPDDEFTAEFPLVDCNFKTTGENPYFILKPGYKLILEGEEDGEAMTLWVTVLDETEDIYLPDIGWVKTRVVEEREWVEDLLVEVSRNWFAVCSGTNSVYYFGEDVDNYEYDDEGNFIETTHEGAWRAGVDDAKPGVIMPGTFLLGSKYYQEQAPGMAMDRAENVEMGLTATTEAGTFHDCVRVEETSALDPCDFSEKIYCPGVGLLVDDEFELTGLGPEQEQAIICATFGTSGFRRDQDTFRFFGTQGETVTVRLEADPPEAGSGKRATLLLRQKTGFFRRTRYFGTLPHEITATLPASGEYLVTVAEQLRSIRRQGYNGDYCVTLEGSPETCQTFEAVSVD